MHDGLQNVVTLLGVGVLVVAIFRRLNLPSIVGYLLAGIVIGPSALGVIPDSQTNRDLAEFGVVFLMFSIGLEFSLPQLLAMRRTVFGLGGAQMLLTALVTWLIAGALGLAWKTGFILGSVVAVSSTAIVAKMLADRLELQSPHGRQIMGVALFQDIAVVPLLVLIPSLNQAPERLASVLGLAALKAGAILVVLLWLGRTLMRKWFHLVAGHKSSELFVLNVFLVTLGLAWITQLAGLSLALGAFVAGILISETEYRHQVEDYIKPFRDVLLGLFFITVGMLLDFGVVLGKSGWVIGVLLAMLVGKFWLVLGLTRLFGSDSAVATRVGLALAPAGEFAFVLLTLAAASGSLRADVTQIMLAAMLLSMLLAPLVIANSDKIVLRFCANEWMNRALSIHSLSVQSLARSNHVIVCGYGRSGQNLARLLRQEEVSTIALDSDPVRVQQASNAGESVVFGDASRREVLMAAGLLRASALVVSFVDTATALKIVSHAHDLKPDLPVIVRTHDDHDLARLKNAGAAEVVPDVLEGSLMLASHALLLMGTPLPRVLARIRHVRRERYQLMRGFFRGESDQPDEFADSAEPRLRSITILESAYAAGKSVEELKLKDFEVEITLLRRPSRPAIPPDPGATISRGDVLVLLGSPPNLKLAEERLLRG